MHVPEPGSEMLAGSQLFRLPEFEPDPALWTRIEAAHQRRSAVRRKRRIGWLAGGLAAACAVVTLFPIAHVQSGDSVAVWQQRSQELEREWQSQSRTQLDPRSRAQLRLIDLDLQSAYDRGAEELELVPLWKLRSSLLRELVDSSGETTRLVTRI